MADFTDAPWVSPENGLSASEYAKCCLIDMTPRGAEPIKANCRLPICSAPGGPINRNALRNAAARIFTLADVPPDTRAKAAKKLVGLMGDAGVKVGSVALLQLAGMRGGRKDAP